MSNEFLGRHSSLASELPNLTNLDLAVTWQQTPNRLFNLDKATLNPQRLGKEKFLSSLSIGAIEIESKEQSNDWENRKNYPIENVDRHAWWTENITGSFRQLDGENDISIALIPEFSGFSNPVHITNAADGSDRLFVVEQQGIIKVIENGQVLSAPFLDISDRVSFGGERGLLSLAFPADYENKDYFYVNYTDLGGNTVVARYSLGSNDNLADPDTEEIILQVRQPFTNHNGGQIAFGADGFLYIGMGDGGGAGDPFGLAQNPRTLLGKILRIDVESGIAPYTIPDSNPFLAENDPSERYRDEIWAVGVRNPWRFSFDRLTGDLFMGDVGQNAVEEINFQSASSLGGENYGWSIYEGSQRYSYALRWNRENLVFPVAEYEHPSESASVTGGFVYRGSDSTLNGTYFYGDFIDGRLWGLTRNGEVWENTLLLDTNYGISTFGEDETGNLYLADYNSGTIFAIAADSGI